MRRNLLKHTLLLGYLLISSLIFTQCSGNAQLEKALKEYAASINKDCPITYDQYTRLDSCEVLSGNTLKYNYTVDFDKLDTGKEEFEPLMKKYLLGGIKIGSEFKGLRDNNVTFQYSYRGLDGTAVHRFSITPDDYNSLDKK